MEYRKIDWNDVWKELMITQQRLDKTGDKKYLNSVSIVNKSYSKNITKIIPR